MHAFIVIGDATKWTKTLLLERSISPHDTITVNPEPTSIGIEAIRTATRRLSIHPVASTHHAVIIHNAHTMTIEAQNAFLKTLEEPVGNAIIILESREPDTLLPTILSRCQLINLGTATQYSDEEITTCIDTVTLLGEVSVGKRLQKIDELTKTRDDALAFTNLAITALEQDLKKTGRHAKLLRSLLTARTQILGNITPKLALDAVFLS